jgi:hypothetical protein
MKYKKKREMVSCLWQGEESLHLVELIQQSRLLLGHCHLEDTCVQYSRQSRL